jgi:hypothetical protein
MTHDEARELMGADPDDASAELLAHLKTCPECQAYREEMLALNAKLKRALELDWQKVQGTAPPGGPPTGPLFEAPSAIAQRTGPTSDRAAPMPGSSASATDRTAPMAGSSATATDRTAPMANSSAPSADRAATATQRQAAPAARATVTPLQRKPRAPVAKHKRPRLFAFAASVAAALVVGATLWLSRPPESLAAEIVTHVEGEPNSWHEVQPVPAEKLDAVLHKSGVKLGTGMEPVVYASSCWFRGHFVPHVVVTTKHGPVTVMILLHEQVHAPQRFNEDGYAGMLVPARTGSVAVLSRTPMDLDQSAADVVHALQSAE